MRPPALGQAAPAELEEEPWQTKGDAAQVAPYGHGARRRASERRALELDLLLDRRIDPEQADSSGRP
jgi:hypothetical protein